ncbi:MAG TPA: hypothetical protein VJ792_06670 [Candidatus Nitrosotalea sp.]|nr:hypothetical protein [Candidatus Nitrosotalea sp.]
MKIILAVLLIASALSMVIPAAHAQSYGQVSSSLKNDSWVVHVNKQVQIAADVTNGLNRDQPFAYIVQVLDNNGVVVQLSWLTGTLTAGQSLNPSQSWTPTSTGNYTAQIFVWSGIDNPDALSPPLVMKISVV